MSAGNRRYCAWPYLVICQESANHPAYSASKKLNCFLLSSARGRFLSVLVHCESDTLNAPADKLLLSELKKLGGHSAISERWA